MQEYAERWANHGLPRDSVLKITVIVHNSYSNFILQSQASFFCNLHESIHSARTMLHSVTVCRTSTATAFLRLTRNVGRWRSVKIEAYQETREANKCHHKTYIGKEKQGTNYWWWIIFSKIFYEAWNLSVAVLTRSSWRNLGTLWQCWGCAEICMFVIMLFWLCNEIIN